MCVCVGGGGSGVRSNPHPCPTFRNILLKWPNYFNFMGSFKKIEIKLAERPPTLYIYEPPSQKSWIRPWTGPLICKMNHSRCLVSNHMAISSLVYNELELTKIMLIITAPELLVNEFACQSELNNLTIIFLIFMRF